MRSFADEVIRWADKSEWLLIPQQARTRESLQRIVGAAVDLFCANGFEETAISGIAERAGVSIGAIYARFADKNAILYTVIETYQRTRIAQFDAIMQPGDWAARSARDIALHYLEIMRSGFEQDRDLILLVERQRMRDPIVAARSGALHLHVAEGLATLLAPHAAALAIDDLPAAARFVHALAYNTMALELLHRILPGDAVLLGDDADGRLRVAVLRYLGIAD